MSSESRGDSGNDIGDSTAVAILSSFHNLYCTVYQHRREHVVYYVSDPNESRVRQDNVVY